MSVRRLLAALALPLLVAGCSSNSPTQPVASVPLSSLTVVPAADTLHVGDAAAFTVQAVDTGGTNVPNPTVHWSSSNTAVVRVSSTGTVSAVGEGTATVTASSGGKTANAGVLVLPAQRGWYRQATVDASVDLNGVWFEPTGNAGWVVGTQGRIAHTTDAGATWATQTSGPFTLNAVWFTSATEGWAAGNAGTILHTTNAGGSWTRQSVATSAALDGITFATRDTGWAVGAGGTIARTFDRGVTWTVTQQNAWGTLRSVAFASTRDGWAVGDAGVVAGTHDRGLTWFRITAPVSWTSSTLYAVARPAVATAVAVGAVGATPRTVVTPDSVAWSYQNAGAAYDLRAVRFIDATHGWAVGSNGGAAVLVTVDGGQNWLPQVATGTNPLHGVWFVDGLRGWAVGNNGTVLHTATGGTP